MKLTRFAHLGCLPPPFILWDRYYIVPASLLNTLKILAHDDPTMSKSDAGTSDLRLDLSLLLKEDRGEEVFLIDTKHSAGQNSLGPGGRKEMIWTVKDGLVENEDFIFVSSQGWDKLISWCVG